MFTRGSGLSYFRFSRNSDVKRKTNNDMKHVDPIKFCEILCIGFMDDKFFNRVGISVGTARAIRSPLEGIFPRGDEDRDYTPTLRDPCRAGSRASEI